jgi:hypothetical protein
MAWTQVFFDDFSGSCSLVQEPRHGDIVQNANSISLECTPVGTSHSWGAGGDFDCPVAHGNLADYLDPLVDTYYVEARIISQVNDEYLTPPGVGGIFVSGGAIDNADRCFSGVGQRYGIDWAWAFTKSDFPDFLGVGSVVGLGDPRVVAHRVRITVNPDGKIIAGSYSADDGVTWHTGELEFDPWNPAEALSMPIWFGLFSTSEEGTYPSVSEFDWIAIYRHDPTTKTVIQLEAEPSPTGPVNNEGAVMCWYPPGNYAILSDSSISGGWFIPRKWDGAAWSDMVPIAAYSFYNSAACFDPDRNLLYVLSMVNYLAVWNGTVWDLKTFTHLPIPPGYSGIVIMWYDTFRHRLFCQNVSGAAKLYEWNFVSEDWEDTGITLPNVYGYTQPNRDFAQGAYDEVRHVMVLFGGRGGPGGVSLDETLICDGTSWERVYSSKPSPRGRHYGRMVFHPHVNRCILVGGMSAYSGYTYFCQDAWSWGGLDWELHGDALMVAASGTIPPAPAPNSDQQNIARWLLQVCWDGVNGGILIKRGEDNQP